MKNFLTYILLALICFSCGGPKLAEKINSNAPDINTTEIDPVEVSINKSNCMVISELSYPLRDDIETAYVIYRDFVKAKEYEEALPIWKKAFYNAPSANGKIKYQFDDGVAIYKALHAATEDNTLKQNYQDTIMSIYDKRIECYPEDRAYVIERKAFDYYYSFYTSTTPRDITTLFETAIDMKGEKADYFIINPFTKLIYDGFIDGSVDTVEAQTYVTKLWDAIEYGNNNCKGKECEAWKIINAYAPARLEALEGVDGFYDCDYYSKKYIPVFQADSTNCETINLVYRRLVRGDCDFSSTDLASVKYAKDNTCYTPPPAPGELRQAYDAYNAGNYTKAIDHFENYVNNSDDPEKKAKFLLVIAKIYYGDIKNFPKARNYARQAAEQKPAWGEPFILIGKLYASSGPLCGPGTGWDSQIVTWPAIDKFEYAKKIDPSVSTEANKWIATYKQYMPSKEDVFFRPDVKVGGSFKVRCWINETTTVRTAD